MEDSKPNIEDSKSFQKDLVGTEGSISTKKPYRKIRSRKTFKRQVLERLHTVGLKDYDQFLSYSEWSEYDPAEIVKYVNNFVRKSQRAKVEVETKHLDFYHKLAELLSPSESTPDVCRTKNEIALAVDALAHLEPSVKNPASNMDPLLQVDILSPIYEHIAILMKGEPSQEPDPECINLMHEAIKEVMAEIESPQGQEDLKKLNDLLVADKLEEFTQGQATGVKQLFREESFNPLQLPMEFFVNKPFFDRSWRKKQGFGVLNSNNFINFFFGKFVNLRIFSLNKTFYE